MKLNCRECEIRTECIMESEQAPGIKEMILRTFETGRDTQDLWENLQRQCLLVRRTKQRRSTLLSKRLKAQADDAAHEGPDDDVNGDRAEQAASPSPTMPTAVHEPARKPVHAQKKKVKEKKGETISSSYCLAPQNGHHRIALPAHGEIVLGRFDLHANVTPDVDLSHYDTGKCLISRQHARIVGRHDRHYIEDMLSTNGTTINGCRLLAGQKVPLQAGDKVTLGGVEFTYTLASKTQAPSPTPSSHAYLQVAFTGNQFALPSWGEVIIGRSDRKAGIVPDIDLSTEGDAAQVVTRRHVKIIARDGYHYVQDMGSTNSTKLNGTRIEGGEFGPLQPGDHLWLGGCVLVYDLDTEYRVKIGHDVECQLVPQGIC
jgi:pSer/pThr/pTyr-binding forkhead associated (FHA) protein